MDSFRQRMRAHTQAMLEAILESPLEENSRSTSSNEIEDEPIAGTSTGRLSKSFKPPSRRTLVQFLGQTDSCALCVEPEDDEMIQCDKCDNWLHYSCCKLTQVEVDRIIKFYCKSCREKYNLMSEWEKVNFEENSIEYRELKSSKYHPITKIIEHDFEDDKRIFKVEWEGVDPSTGRPWTPSWEWEHNLDGSLDLLQDYCISKNIELSTIVGRAGNVSSLDETPNFVEITKIHQTFLKVLEGMQLKTSLKIEIWNSSTYLKEDGMYFIYLEGHCYILLYYSYIDIGYIADGSNAFINVKSVRMKLGEMTGKTLFPRRFLQQRKVDHCASSAVVIALDMVRHYNTDVRQHLIIAERRLHDRIIRLFHKTPSQDLVPKRLHEHQMRLICNYCNKKFAKGKIRNLKCHIFRCSKR